MWSEATLPAFLAAMVDPTAAVAEFVCRKAFGSEITDVFVGNGGDVREAFLTQEALDNIAATTVDNALKFFQGTPNEATEVCLSK